jgi:polar amino acid transport system substrate-binding protein
MCTAVLFFTCSAASAGAATLHVAADVSGAPFEFFMPNSHVPVGFDIDLLQAIAVKLGTTIDITNHQFDDLLAAVRAGRFNAAMSAISDTSKREKVVDFLDYFVAGGGIMVAAGNPSRIFSLDGLCGYAVTVESGTSYESDLQAQSAACKQIGLGPIRVLSFPTDDDAYAAFAAGKSTAYVADYPVGVYRAHGANDGKEFEVVGRQFQVVPYGIAFAKGNEALRSAFQNALLQVVADGSYDRLLTKWGLTQGGLRFAPVNAGKLYEHAEHS